MRILCLIFPLLLSFNAHAQLNATSDWETGAFTGPLLPSSIAGLRETIMMTGFRIGKGMSYYRPELVYAQGNEAGSSFQVFILTFKNPIYLEGLDDIRPFFLTGIQVSQYEPVYNNVTSAKEQGNGFHLGFGIEMDLSQDIQVRNDYYFSNGPGRVLMVGLGFQFRFGGDSSANAN